MPIQKPIIQPTHVNVATWSPKGRPVESMVRCEIEPEEIGEDDAAHDAGGGVLVSSQTAALGYGRGDRMFKSCRHTSPPTLAAAAPRANC